MALSIGLQFDNFRYKKLSALSLSLNLSGRFGRVIITAKDGNKNLLRKEVWQELRLLDDIIQNATVTYEGETFTYHEACARWENECFTNDILNLDHIIEDVSLAILFLILFNQSINYNSFDLRKF
jgi:Patched family